MPYYPELNLLFIHIPKTGGTKIEDNLREIYDEELFSMIPNDIFPEPYQNISLQHQLYVTFLKFPKLINFDLEKVKIFTVIRNPYNRIISGLFWRNLIKKISKPDEVFEVIKNKYLYRDDLDNHNLPQHKFITDSKGKLIPGIRIFHTETLNEDNEELNKFLGTEIDIFHKKANTDYSKYLNNDSIQLINEFYQRDFEIFNFEMKKINPDKSLISKESLEK